MPDLSLTDGLDLVGCTVEELWPTYLAVGGRATLKQLSERIRAGAELDAVDHNCLAQALNELFIDCGIGTFPVGYRPSPATGPDYTGRARAARTQASAVAKRARSQTELNSAARAHNSVLRSRGRELLAACRARHELTPVAAPDESSLRLVRILATTAGR